MNASYRDICCLWKLYISATLEILGLLATFYSIVGHIYIKWIDLTVIVVTSLIASYFRVLYKKKSVTIKLNAKTDLKIYFGDLFDNNGVTVIPVNDYFDTHVGDGIISDKTIHGQFITKYFHNSIDELDKLIKKQLENLEPCRINDKRKKVADLNLNSNSYNLGTCIRVYVKDRLFILLVTTRFDDDNHAILNKSEYPLVIKGLYEGIYRLNEDNPVYMPLVGSGRAEIDASLMQQISYMVNAAFYADKSVNHNGINLVLYDSKDNKDNKEKISLNVINYLYNRVNLKNWY